MCHQGEKRRDATKFEFKSKIIETKPKHNDEAISWPRACACGFSYFFYYAAAAGDDYFLSFGFSDGEMPSL